MRFQDQLYLRIETSLHLPLTSVAIQIYHKSRKSIKKIRFWWHILSPTANICHQLRFGLLVIWFLTSPLISKTKTDKNSSDSCLAMRRITWIELTFVISLFSSMKLNVSVLRSSSAYGQVTERNINSRNKSAEIRTRYSYGSVKSDFKYRYVMQRVSHEISQFSVTNFSKQVTSVTFSLLYNHHLWSVLNHFFRVFFKNFEIFEMWFCLVNRGQLWLWINPCVSESREWLIFRLF